jgi:hypothetical protein
MNRKLDSPAEQLGLLAIGSSGRWEVAVDESSDAEEWSMEIEGPGIYLVFQLQDPTIIPMAMRFLQTGLAENWGKSQERNERELHLGRFGSASVSFHWDNEDVPRCFLIVGPKARSTLRLSLGVEDVTMLCEALDEIVKEPPFARPSAVQIITGFTAMLARRLEDNLGEGWWVWDEVREKGIEPEDGWEILSLGKAAWNSIEKDLRIALAYDDAMPGPVYFTARAGEDVAYNPQHKKVGDRIAAALMGAHRGSRTGYDWWPHWGIWRPKYRDWSADEVLRELRKDEVQNSALAYFLEKLTAMARTMESSVEACLQEANRV